MPGSDEGVTGSVFRRSTHNPILAVRSLPFPAGAVLNPGATEQDGEVVLLPRVENTRGFSSIHVARSRNGVDEWRVAGEPILEHGHEEWRYERWGCEDARVTYLPEQGEWAIAYVAYSRFGPAVGIARSRDLVTAERTSLLGPATDKDAALFPTKFGDRWAILHRPDAAGQEHIWLAYSTDLVRWGEHHCVLYEGEGPAWHNLKVGAGPPPIRVKDGWLLVFHGVKSYGSTMSYRAGAALLDPEEPHRLLAMSRGWIFQAEEPYETSGLVPNVVYPSGAVVRGEELWMYYGAADTCVCLATARIDEVLSVLEPV
jgi:predicted GH43/DUF377 family glycosyl hydrolase